MCTQADIISQVLGQFGSLTADDIANKINQLMLLPYPISSRQIEQAIYREWRKESYAFYYLNISGDRKYSFDPRYYGRKGP